jgi:hypothetical protein
LILVNYVAKEAPYSSSEIQPTMTNGMQREVLALYSGEIQNAIIHVSAEQQSLLPMPMPTNHATLLKSHNKVCK